MTFENHLLRLALATTLLITACATPREASPAPTGGLKPVPAVAPADHADAPHANPSTAPRTNRDLHGPADTQDYIDRLRSEARVRELKPELVASKIEPFVAKDGVIADVGCGPGVFAKPFAALVPDGFVLAADVEPAQLDALREVINDEELTNVVPVLASYATPHIPPNTCDAIFVADTYHHIEERVTYFARLARALKPDGRLVILEYKEGDIPVGPPAAHKIPVATRHAELEAAGYELETTHATHMWQDLEVWQRKRFFR